MADTVQREQLVGIDDVAQHLGVSVSSVRRAVREDGLPSMKIGGLRKFRMSLVDRWVDGQVFQTTNDVSIAPSAAATAQRESEKEHR